MSFGEHLEELRTRVVRLLLGGLFGMIVCFVFSDKLMAWMLAPLDLALAYNHLPRQIVVIDPVENFMVVMKISIYCGLILTAPYGLYQVWAFVAAGLYPHEQKHIKRFFPASVILFFTGVFFCFLVILPLAFTFLLSIRTWVPAPQAQENILTRLILGERTRTTTQPTTQPALITTLPILTQNPPHPNEGHAWINPDERQLRLFANGKVWATALSLQEGDSFVTPQLTLDQTITFVTNLALGFGIGFQVPVVVVLLALIGLASVETMARARRYVILGIVIASAIITPTPDITSQMLLAVPMWLLYEAGLVVAKISLRRRQQAEAESSSWSD